MLITSFSLSLIVLQAIDVFQVGLDPAIKNFIVFISILGPISIFALILILKNIEKRDPGRIRWK